MCLSHLIYTVRPCLIHTCHAMPMPCSDNAVLLKATAQHGSLSTAVLCCELEKKGMVGAWHGHGMATVNQTRSHCVNQMGKTHSKHLAARHGNGILCVNRPLPSKERLSLSVSFAYMIFLLKFIYIYPLSRVLRNLPILVSIVRSLIVH